MLLNKVNRFILTSFLIMFVVQFVPGLRVPLLGGYLIILVLINLNKLRVDDISKVFIFLLLYFVVQNLLLQEVVTLLDFFQSCAMMFFYISFHMMTKGYLKNISSNDLKKVQYIVSFLIPVFFISLTEWNHLRKAGILGNPNISAHTLLTIFPFVFLLKPSKKHFLYLMSVMFFVITMLASRSALLAFLLGMGGYFIAVSKRRHKYWLVFYASIALLLSYFAVDIATYLFNFLDSSTENSRLFYTGYNGRDNLLERAMIRFYNGNTWLGLGFTNSKFEIARDHFHGTHNGFLDLLLRSGYIGTCIYSIILIKFLFGTIKIRNLQKRAAVFFSYVSILSLTTNSSTFFVFNFVFFYFIFIYNLSQNSAIDEE